MHFIIKLPFIKYRCTFLENTHSVVCVNALYVVSKHSICTLILHLNNKFHSNAFIPSSPVYIYNVKRYYILS